MHLSMADLHLHRLPNFCGQLNVFDLVPKTTEAPGLGSVVDGLFEEEDGERERERGREGGREGGASWDMRQVDKQSLLLYQRSCG